MIIKNVLALTIVISSFVAYGSETRLRDCLIRSIRRTAFLKIDTVRDQAGVINFPDVSLSRATSTFISSDKRKPEEVCKGAADTSGGKDYEIWRGALSGRFAEIVKNYKAGQKFKEDELSYFFWFFNMHKELEAKNLSQEEFCEFLANKSKLHPRLTKGVYPGDNHDIVHEIDATKWESLNIEKACIIALPISREIHKARGLGQ